MSALALEPDQRAARGRRGGARGVGVLRRRPASHGGAGRAAWRLCGLLSQLLIAGRRAASRARRADPEQGGVAAPLVLALGLGCPGRPAAGTLQGFAAEGTDRARRLRRSRIAWLARPPAVPARRPVTALLYGVGAAGRWVPGGTGWRWWLRWPIHRPSRRPCAPASIASDPNFRCSSPCADREARSGGPRRSPLSAPPRASGSVKDCRPILTLGEVRARADSRWHFA